MGRDLYACQALGKDPVKESTGEIGMTHGAVGERFKGTEGRTSNNNSKRDSSVFKG